MSGKMGSVENRVKLLKSTKQSVVFDNEKSINEKSIPSKSMNLPPLNEGNSEELFVSTQPSFIPNKQLEFSPEAKAVFEAGRELWRYYFEKLKIPRAFGSPLERGKIVVKILPSKGDAQRAEGITNPSLYDIKAYFQGVDESGRMNNKSRDENYNLLIAKLRESLEILATKIQPKVYEFGFLL
jgi:hypothetical protein